MTEQKPKTSDPSADNYPHGWSYMTRRLRARAAQFGTISAQEFAEHFLTLMPTNQREIGMDDACREWLEHELPLRQEGHRLRRRLLTLMQNSAANGGNCNECALTAQAIEKTLGPSPLAGLLPVIEANEAVEETVKAILESRPDG